MQKDFDIGDKVVCRENGISGKVIQFYRPTACAEQTMVITDDGRKYHAPTMLWARVN